MTRSKLGRRLGDVYKIQDQLVMSTISMHVYRHGIEESASWIFGSLSVRNSDIRFVSCFSSKGSKIRDFIIIRVFTTKVDKVKIGKPVISRLCACVETINIHQ